jgi:inner membrane protein
VRKEASVETRTVDARTLPDGALNLTLFRKLNSTSENYRLGIRTNTARVACRVPLVVTGSPNTVLTARVESSNRHTGPPAYTLTFSALPLLDNITHSLAGLLLADAIVRRHQRRNVAATDAQHWLPLSRTAAIIGVVGANLPDIDVPWGMLLQRVGVYDEILTLLHHRGYTHTFFAAIIGVPLLWLAGQWILRRQMQRRTATASAIVGARSALLMVATVAILSHLLLDFTNDYGVHPLSPFSNLWFYGDSVFIIEPWLWIAAVPALIRSVTRRAAQAALATILAIGIALCWVVPIVSHVPAIIATVSALSLFFALRKVPTQRASTFGIALWVAVTCSFALGSRAVSRNVRHASASQPPVTTQSDSAFRTVDVIVSPTPANPVCARVISVDLDKSHYRLTTAWASAMPSLVSAGWCARAVGADTLSRGAAHLRMNRTSNHRSTDAIAWSWTWSAPRAELNALQRNNCHVAAWLRFVRAPFWMQVGEDSILVGDLRYDREPAARVARYTLPIHVSECPPAVPPWLQPRSDILTVD